MKKTILSPLLQGLEPATFPWRVHFDGVALTELSQLSRGDLNSACTVLRIVVDGPLCDDQSISFAGLLKLSPFYSESGTFYILWSESYASVVLTKKCPSTE